MGSASAIKTRGFPPPSHDGFGFIQTGSLTPKRMLNVLLGDRRAQFEGFLHLKPSTEVRELGRNKLD
jgi:hypothetical protein